MQSPEDDVGDDVTPEQPMTAGQFGMATMLSAKALRLYADRGLLVPLRIGENGYRYYGHDQVRTGWLISLLRSADLSLDLIGVIVHAPADESVRLIDQAIDDQSRRTAGNRAMLDRARRQLEGAAVNEPTTVTEAERPVLSVLRRMRPAEMEVIIPGQTSRLRAIATEAGLAVTGPAFGIFHSPITDDSDGPLEIVVPVDDLIDAPDADVRSYRLAGGRLALRRAVGEETFFPQILALYDELNVWVSAAGRTPTGPPREIWHNSPHDPEPLDLTIAWPYA